MIGDASVYDAMSRLLLGAFFDGVADDVERTAHVGAHVLEVGCGPGHLAIRLAERGLDVTALDVDPAMIRRARTNAERVGRRHRRSWSATSVRWTSPTRPSTWS